MQSQFIRRPEAVIQVAVLSRMLLEALEACDPPLASEALVADLGELREQTHTLLEAEAVERARDPGSAERG